MLGVETARLQGCACVVSPKKGVLDRFASVGALVDYYGRVTVANSLGAFSSHTRARCGQL